MDFLELMKKRYTTKKYDANKIVSTQNIEKLKEILRLSPSSINSQPWNFTFVSDSKLKKQLAEHSFFNKEKIEEASHLVVFSCVNDVKFFLNEIEGYLPQGAVDYYRQKLESNSEEQIKTWISNQVYISLGIFLAACASLNIDSSPLEGIDKETYTEILGNDKYKVLCAVAIGYRSEDDFNQLHLKPKQRRALQDIISEK